jgi:hypothetical protein
MRATDDTNPLPFYHGTRADLKPGDLIAPGYCSNYGSRRKANFVYLSATLEAATWGAELALGDGRERIRRSGCVSPERSSSLGSRLTDAGRQPPQYLPVRIATGRDSLHRLLSEGLSLLFGLSLVLRKRHPFADDFAARLVFRLHVKILWPRRWPAAA